MSESLKQSVVALGSGLTALWKESSFQPTTYKSPFFTRHEANTKVDDNAARMPVSGHPIRGMPGVEVAREVKISKEEATEDLISDSYVQEQSFYSEELNHRIKDLRDAVVALGEAVDADFPLEYRLWQSCGYKTWSSSQFADRDRKRDSGLWHSGFSHFLALKKRLARSLIAHGFDPASRGQFEDWPEVVEEIILHLQDLRTLDRYEYEVQIFLNGPAADLESEALVVHLKQNEEPISVAMGYATDQLVSQLIEYDRQTVPDYAKINTVFRYKITLCVEDVEESYLQAYPKASRVGALLLDGLRLLRPGDDIGILALEIAPIHDFAPEIRKTWAESFQAELARFYPKRFDFGVSQLSPFQEGEVKDLGRLVSLLIGESGRSRPILQARSRLANSIDRYAPDDPEKLIEYAIALESLFLSDDPNNHSELSYRLALRAARLLEEDLESRISCFRTIRNLYTFRSRLVHGGSLENLNPAQEKKLKDVLLRCPVILSKSIRALLESGPSLVGKKSVKFWQELELR